MKGDLVHALSPPCLTCHSVQKVRVRFLVKAKEVKVSQVFKGPEVLAVRGQGGCNRHEQEKRSWRVEEASPPPPVPF